MFGYLCFPPHALEGVCKNMLNEYVPNTSGSKVGNHQRVRSSLHPHDMNPLSQQTDEFFYHLAKSMHDPNGINFEKMRKMGRVEFKGNVDLTDAEKWLDHMEKVFRRWTILMLQNLSMLFHYYKMMLMIGG